MLTLKHRNHMGRMVAGVVVLLLALAGCNNMVESPYLETYDESPTFGRAARELEPGAIAVGHLEADEAFYRGTDGGQYIEEIPVEITQVLLERGQEQYNSFCSPCHGYSGHGNGVITQEGFAAQSFYDRRIAFQPVGRYFETITMGRGSMYSYAARIEAEDRWAIVAYMEALKLGQSATYDDLPAELQAELDALAVEPSEDAAADEMGG